MHNMVQQSVCVSMPPSLFLATYTDQQLSVKIRQLISPSLPFSTIQA